MGEMIMDLVQQDTDFSITITSSAMKQLAILKDQEDIANFRVSILPGGCSGFQYDIGLETVIDEDDVILEHDNGINIIIDPFSAQYLNGTLIHYTTSMMGSGFTFNNPNSSGGCGCGSSFTV
jgi:iron-sulfur cluster assembly accessory protein